MNVFFSVLLIELSIIAQFLLLVPIWELVFTITPAAREGSMAGFHRRDFTREIHVPEPSGARRRNVDKEKPEAESSSLDP